MRPPSLISLLSLYAFSSTFSIGAFPALLPELGTVAGLADWQIGLVAGLLGFARMAADVPAGLVITHHLRRALTVAPFLLTIGAICLACGGSFVLLALGRAAMGVGHALTVVGGLTALLRFGPVVTMGSTLTAFEMSAMIGVLGGTVFIGLLPSRLSGNVALLIACSPQLLTFAVLPRVLTVIPRDQDTVARSIFAREEGRRTDSAPMTAGVLLAFAAGVVTALTYSTLEQFVIPLRGHREFRLDRHGIAGLLMNRPGRRRRLSASIRGARRPMRRRPRARSHLDRLRDGDGPRRARRLPSRRRRLRPLWRRDGGLAAAARIAPACDVGGQIGWPTAVYRVGVDGGILLGPFLSGLLAVKPPRVLPAICATSLIALGALILVRR